MSLDDQLYRDINIAAPIQCFEQRTSLVGSDWALGSI